MSILGTIGAAAATVGVQALASSLQNHSSKKLQDRAFQQSLYASNTAHQREVEDLKAAGLNPVLSANSGASAPTATAPEYENPISSALDRAIQTAYAKEELTALHEQNKQMKFENDFLDQYGNYLKSNRMAIDNAQTATALSQERSAALESDILNLEREFTRNTYKQREELLGYQHTLAKNNSERDDDLRSWEKLNPGLVNAARTAGAVKPFFDAAVDVTGMYLNHRNSARSAAIAERNSETAVQRLNFDVRRYEEGKTRRRRR